MISLTVVTALVAGAAFYWRDELKTRVLKIDPVSASMKTSLRGLLLTREDIPLALGFITAAEDADSSTTDETSDDVDKRFDSCIPGGAATAMFYEESASFERDPFTLVSDVSLYSAPAAAAAELSVFDDAGTRECVRRAFKYGYEAAMPTGASVQEVLLEVRRDPAVGLEHRFVTVTAYLTIDDTAVVSNTFIVAMVRDAVLVSLKAQTFTATDAPAEDPVNTQALMAALEALEGRLATVELAP